MQECLRAVHQSARERVLAEIARRTANGVPLDDGDGPITDPGDYVPRDDLDGVEVRLFILSERRKGMLQAAHDQAMGRFLRENTLGGEDRDEVAVAEALGAVFDARRAYVAEVVKDIAGVDGVARDGERLSESTLDALERAKLINPLFVAAQHLQGLDAAKAARFGRLPASTSPVSIVESAQSSAASLAGVTVGPSTSMAAPPSLQGLPTQPTRAPGGT